MRSGCSGRGWPWISTQAIRARAKTRYRRLAALGERVDQGRDVDPVILDEKLRSERIQEEGIRFVRWMWDDLTSPCRLEAKLLRAGVPRH